MRFLHTGDWHLGKPLRHRARWDEYERALAQIVSIAKDEKVDALLIGGDTFDTYAPPTEAERMLNDALAECCGAGIQVVVIGGNHDNPKRLAALVRILDPLRIYMRPEVARPDEGGVIELVSRQATERAKIALLPFIHERRVVTAMELMYPPEQWYQEYAGRLQQILAALTAGFGPETVNVVLGHVLVHGALVGTGERKLHLGQIYGLTPQALPNNAQYIGLNHLHRPQLVPAPSPTAYSGSILSLDFGEVDQAKRVVIVDVHPGRPAEIRSIPLTAGRPLLDVSGTMPELVERAPSLQGAYLRVKLKVPAPAPGLMERVREILPDAMEVTLDYPRNEAAASLQPSSQEPIDLLRAYYGREHSAEMPEAMAALFSELYEAELHAAP